MYKNRPIAVVTYKVFRGTAPWYLWPLTWRLADVSGRHILRSAATNKLIVPLCELSTSGTLAFLVVAAMTWNALVWRCRFIIIRRLDLISAVFRRSFCCLHLSGPFSSLDFTGHSKNLLIWVLMICLCPCRKVQGRRYGREVSTRVASTHRCTGCRHRRIQETGLQDCQRVFPQAGRRLTEQRYRLVDRY